MALITHAILLSGFRHEEREQLTKLTEAVEGGKFVEAEEFSDRNLCTHIICPKPSRSEKFLGGLITGKWLLHPDYIRASHKAGKWVAEEKFEWSTALAQYVPRDLHPFLTAPRRLRERMEQTGNGPFVGWSAAVIVVNPQKKIVYNRLLRLGGACVLEWDQSNPVDLRDLVTHVFVDEENANEVKAASRAGVLCLDPLFIGDFLMRDPPLDPTPYLVHRVLCEKSDNCLCGRRDCPSHCKAEAQATTHARVHQAKSNFSPRKTRNMVAVEESSKGISERTVNKLSQKTPSTAIRRTRSRTDNLNIPHVDNGVDGAGDRSKQAITKQCERFPTDTGANNPNVSHVSSLCSSFNGNISQHSFTSQRPPTGKKATPCGTQALRNRHQKPTTPSTPSLNKSMDDLLAKKAPKLGTAVTTTPTLKDQSTPSMPKEGATLADKESKSQRKLSVESGYRSNGCDRISREISPSDTKNSALDTPLDVNTPKPDTKHSERNTIPQNTVHNEIDVDTKQSQLLVNGNGPDKAKDNAPKTEKATKNDANNKDNNNTKPDIVDLVNSDDKVSARDSRPSTPRQSHNGLTAAMKRMKSSPASPTGKPLKKPRRSASASVVRCHDIRKFGVVTRKNTDDDDNDPGSPVFASKVQSNSRVVKEETHKKDTKSRKSLLPACVSSNQTMHESPQLTPSKRKSDQNKNPKRQCIPEATVATSTKSEDGPSNPNPTNGKHELKNVAKSKHSSGATAVKVKESKSIKNERKKARLRKSDSHDPNVDRLSTCSRSRHDIGDFVTSYYKYQGSQVRDRSFTSCKSLDRYLELGSENMRASIRKQSKKRLSVRSSVSERKPLQPIPPNQSKLTESVQQKLVDSKRIPKTPHEQRETVCLCFEETLNPYLDLSTDKVSCISHKQTKRKSSKKKGSCPKPTSIPNKKTPFRRHSHQFKASPKFKRNSPKRSSACICFNKNENSSSYKENSVMLKSPWEGNEAPVISRKTIEQAPELNLTESEFNFSSSLTKEKILLNYTIQNGNPESESQGLPTDPDLLQALTADEIWLNYTIDGNRFVKANNSQDTLLLFQLDGSRDEHDAGKDGRKPQRSQSESDRNHAQTGQRSKPSGVTAKENDKQSKSSTNDIRSQTSDSRRQALKKTVSSVSDQNIFNKSSVRLRPVSISESEHSDQNIAIKQSVLSLFEKSSSSLSMAVSDKSALSETSENKGVRIKVKCQPSEESTHLNLKYPKIAVESTSKKAYCAYKGCKQTTPNPYVKLHKISPETLESYRNGEIKTRIKDPSSPQTVSDERLQPIVVLKRVSAKRSPETLESYRKGEIKTCTKDPSSPQTVSDERLQPNVVLKRLSAKSLEQYRYVPRNERHKKLLTDIKQEPMTPASSSKSQPGKQTYRNLFTDFAPSLNDTTRPQSKPKHSGHRRQETGHRKSLKSANTTSDLQRTFKLSPDSLRSAHVSRSVSFTPTSKSETSRSRRKLGGGERSTSGSSVRLSFKKSQFAHLAHKFESRSGCPFVVWGSTSGQDQAGNSSMECHAGEVTPLKDSQKRESGPTARENHGRESKPTRENHERESEKVARENHERESEKPSRENHERESDKPTIKTETHQTTTSESNSSDSVTQKPHTIAGLRRLPKVTKVKHQSSDTNHRTNSTSHRSMSLSEEKRQDNSQAKSQSNGSVRLSEGSIDTGYRVPHMKSSASNRKDSDGSQSKAGIKRTVSTDSNASKTNSLTVQETMRKLRKRQLKCKTSARAPVFYEPLTPQQLAEMKTTPGESKAPLAHELDAAFTEIFNTELEGKCYMRGVHYLGEALSAERYPKAKSIVMLIKDCLLTGEPEDEGDEVLQNEICLLLHSTLRLHQPVSKRMQKYYHKLLNGLFSEEKKDKKEEMEEKGKKDPPSLFSIIRHCVEGNQLQMHMPVLKFLVAILEADFYYYSLHVKEYVMGHEPSKPAPCLLAHILWPKLNLSLGILNNECRDLLQLFVQAVQKDDHKMVEILSLLVAMSGEISRHAANVFFSSPGCPPHNNSSTIIRELAHKIQGDCVSSSGVRVAVHALAQHSPWLALHLCETLLDFFDDSLAPPAFRNVTTPCSLTKIVARYFFLLPRPACQAKAGAVSSPTGVSAQKHEKTINKRNPKGESVLHKACMLNKVDQVREYLAVPGVKVNLPDFCGWTPLHESCNRGNLACVQLLLDYRPSAQGEERVDILAQNSDRLTALHDAVQNNNVDIAKLLLEYGGEELAAVKDKDNKTAADYASSDAMRAALLLPGTGRSQYAPASASYPRTSGGAGNRTGSGAGNGAGTGLDSDAAECYVYLVSRALHLYLELHQIASVYSVSDYRERRGQGEENRPCIKEEKRRLGGWAVRESEVHALERDLAVYADLPRHLEAFSRHVDRLALPAHAQGRLRMRLMAMRATVVTTTASTAASDGDVTKLPNGQVQL